MEERLRAFLVLGCNGLRLESFTLCKSIKNIILDLNKLSDGHYKELVEFFDNACGLFDAPINDYNKCVNIISYLHKNYNLYNAEEIARIQSFIKLHRDCGIWLVLILSEDYQDN